MNKKTLEKLVIDDCYHLLNYKKQKKFFYNLKRFCLKIKHLIKY